MSYYNIINMKSKEFIYRAAQLSEAHWLLGHEVTFRSAKSYKLNLQGDPIIEYDDPIVINIGIQDLTRATLEKRGWITEGDDPSIIANISSIVFPKYREWKREGSDISDTSSFIIDVTRYSEVTIPYKFGIDGESVFRIMDIYGDDTRPLVWECRLAPVRGTTDVNNSTEEVEEILDDRDYVVGILDRKGDDSAKLEDYQN